MNLFRRLGHLLPGILTFMAPELSGADMLIVTPAGMADEAEALASLHRTVQGMDVEVVTDTDIAPELDAGAVKEYVVQRREGGLRYLLIIGEGYDDEHSDAWYGMPPLSPHDTEWFTEPEIAVGRLPVVTAAQLADYTVKAARYLSEGSSRYSREVLIACDNGDSHEHLDRAERLAAELSNEVVHKAYVGLDRLVGGKAVITRDRIVRALNDGVGMMIYVGHGNAVSVTGEGLWDAVTAAGMKNSQTPWAFFSSCAINSFHRFETTLGEAMVYNPAGGAIGVIGATDAVYSSYNQEIALSFLDKRKAMSSTVAAGDLWLATQRECIGAARRTLNGFYGKNVIAYSFIGDPALPVYYPDCEVTCSEPAELHCGSPCVITGSVTGGDGMSPDGMVEMIVYAPLCEMPTLGEGGDGKGRPVTCGGDVLWRGVADVSDLSFSREVVLPGSQEGDVRIAMHFLSTDGKRGSGMSGYMTLLPAPEGETTGDITLPEIAMHYDEGLLTAEVSDSGSGVNSSACLLGSSPVLTVDGAVRLPLSVECDGGGNVVFSASAGHLQPGRHEACLAVSDNAGNRAEERLQFTVAGGLPSISLLIADEVARESVEIGWIHDMPGDVELKLVVTGLTGDTVMSEVIAGGDNSYEWNLAGVESGIYLVRLLATDGHRHISAEPRYLTIIRE